MADLYKDGEDFGDLKGMITEEDYKNGKVISTICEECELILVDFEGNCIIDNCLKKGIDGHGYKGIKKKKRITKYKSIDGNFIKD